MDKRLTICTVAFNAADALALMWESYLRYHVRPFLYGVDHGSMDGADVYLRQEADYYEAVPDYEEHGQGLDRICLRVETPYTLVVDTDCEFFAPVMEDMLVVIEDSNAFCVTIAIDHAGPEKAATWAGHLLTADRASPVCALFRTEPLQHYLKYCSFGTYALNQRKFFDSGAMVYHVASAAGETFVSPPWMRDRIGHYGELSSLWLPGHSAEHTTKLRERYHGLSARLHELRRIWQERGPHQF